MPGLVGLLLLMLPPATRAHPHVFIECGVEFCLCDSGLAGMRITWQVDQLNSAWIVKEFDHNGNGRFDPGEQKSVREQFVSGSSKANYYTRLTYGLHRLDTVTVEQFHASIRDGAFVVYSFYVPCNFTTRSIGNRPVYLTFEDPTIYMAFDVVRKRVSVRESDRIGGAVSFSSEDYSEVIVLTLTRKQ